jgi:hypothetical protein
MRKGVDCSSYCSLHVTLSQGKVGKPEGGVDWGCLSLFQLQPLSLSLPFLVATPLLPPLLVAVSVSESLILPLLLAGLPFLVPVLLTSPSLWLLGLLLILSAPPLLLRRG